jgi:uncharacterized tellurite resistance protein B-like protein
MNQPPNHTPFPVYVDELTETTAGPPPSPENPLRASLGGTLKACDPRRYFVEVMVAAMHADGEIDEREVQRLEHIMRSHDLFAGLAPHVAHTMVELARDAIAFSDSAEQRANVVAERLPSRSHRLAAYAMACEVIAADEVVAPTEARYLAHLRNALMIGDHEHRALLAAASRGHGMWALEAAASRSRGLLPAIVDAIVLRRIAAAAIIDHHERRRIEQIVATIEDFGAHFEAIEQSVAKASSLYGKTRRWEVHTAHLANAFPDMADRYWIAMYVATYDVSRGATEWREIKFYYVLRSAFGLADEVMDRVMRHAAAIAEPAI